MLKVAFLRNYAPIIRLFTIKCVPLPDFLRCNNKVFRFLDERNYENSIIA